MFNFGSNMIQGIGSLQDIYKGIELKQDKPGFWGNLGNSFKNNDDTFDFGAIGDGVGSLASIFGAYNAMQQLGLNKDMFKLNKGITLDNHNNSIALAQQDLNDRARMRGIDSGYGTEAAQAAALGLPAPVSTPTLQNTFGGNTGNPAAPMQVNPNQPVGYGQGQPQGQPMANMGAPTLQQLQQQAQSPYGSGYSQKGVAPYNGG